MPDKPDKEETSQMVAPGYPAIETIRQIDVSGWEPAAVFVPVNNPGAITLEEGTE